MIENSDPRSIAQEVINDDWSNSALKTLAEAYLRLDEWRTDLMDLVMDDSLARDGWEMIEAAIRDHK